MLPESCLTARRFKEGVVDGIAHLGAWRVQCRVVLEWVICRSMGGFKGGISDDYASGIADRFGCPALHY